MAAQPRIKLALVGTGAELVQAVDAREYERLLAITPPGIEVMGAYGARLVLSLLSRPF